MVVCETHKVRKKGVCDDCLGCKLCPPLTDCQLQVQFKVKQGGHVGFGKGPGFRKGQKRSSVEKDPPARRSLRTTSIPSSTTDISLQTSSDYTNDLQDSEDEDFKDQKASIMASHYREQVKTILSPEKFLMRKK